MKPQMPERNVVIVGAGLAGTLMAMFLARRGWRVDLYERRPDPRVTRIRSGRSINMTLAVRGLAALGEVLDPNKILDLTIPLEGRMVHQFDGSLKFHSYGIKRNEVIYAITRSSLNARLMDLSEETYPNIKIWFNHSCKKIDLENWKIDICDELTQEHKLISPDFVVGADGTFSTVRQQMHRSEYANFRQEYLESGYRELVFAAGPGRKFQMASNVLHLWPRGRSMLMAIPNLDGTFACNCILPFNGADSFARLNTPATVMDFFRAQFPDAVGLIEGLPHSFLRNPPAGFPTTWAYPWHSGERIVLIGDACHTVVPFYGLGMNAAFEDCAVLDQSISKHGKDLASAFREYQEMRKVNTDALAELSLENFIELRDKVRSPVLAARKRVFVALHKIFPKTVVPLYTMMSHTRMPFAAARRRAKIQDRWASWLGVDVVVWIVAFFQICSGLSGKFKSLWSRQPTSPIPISESISGPVAENHEWISEDTPREKTVSYS